MYTNARLRFEQSHIHTPFFFSVYNLLCFYVKTAPILRKRFDKRTKKTYNTWHFSTVSIPYFTNFYSLFYSNGVKIVPKNIFDLLTPTALAFWIMCDGFRYNKGVGLATDSFTVKDVQLLCNVLKDKFGLQCKIYYSGSLPRIDIHSSSLITLQKLVLILLLSLMSKFTYIYIILLGDVLLYQH